MGDIEGKHYLKVQVTFPPIAKAKEKKKVLHLACLYLVQCAGEHARRDDIKVLIRERKTRYGACEDMLVVLGFRGRLTHEAEKLKRMRAQFEAKLRDTPFFDDKNGSSIIIDPKDVN